MQVNAGAKLTFGGTDENSGMLHLYSAGKLGPEKNNEYAKDHTKAKNTTDQKQKKKKGRCNVMLVFNVVDQLH